MKRLSLLRHAKSSSVDPHLDDFNRPLVERGWKAARRVGRELKRRDVAFDLCVASTAARVRETLDGLLEGYGNPDFEIRFEPRLYAATTSTLLDIVRHLPDGAGTVLFVGHNPGMQQLALELTRADDEGLRARIAAKFPTAALATIDLRQRHWDDIQPGSGELVELMIAKELD